MLGHKSAVVLTYQKDKETIKEESKQQEASFSNSHRPQQKT